MQINLGDYPGIPPVPSRRTITYRHKPPVPGAIEFVIWGVVVMTSAAVALFIMLMLFLLVASPSARAATAECAMQKYTQPQIFDLVRRTHRNIVAVRRELIRPTLDEKARERLASSLGDDQRTAKEFLACEQKP